MFVSGQINQAITSSNSVTDYFISEWISHDEGNKITLERYKEACNKPPVKSKPFSEVIQKQGIDKKTCAKKANAMDLYSVIENAKKITALSWPLNQM